MKKTYVISLVILIFLGFSSYFLFFSGSEVEKISLKKGPIVAFGDSLVVGVGASTGKDFVSLLSLELDKPIINLGKSGNTTADALKRIEEVTSLEPALVIILLGGNDYLRKVPMNETFSNLGEIIDILKQNDTAVLLLGVRGGLLTDIYKERFEEVAEDKDVSFVPNVLDGLLGDRSLMSDTIHPNDAGYKKIAEKVLPVLKEMLGE